jgi:hypothetical protein
LHGKDDKKSIKKYSDIIHKYQRNTFNHGYQARGVYLSHEIPDVWQINEGEGFLVLNPYPFWNLFKKTYEDIFSDILKSKNMEYRCNALKYLERLLN